MLVGGQQFNIFSDPASHEKDFSPSLFWGTNEKTHPQAQNPRDKSQSELSKLL